MLMMTHPYYPCTDDEQESGSVRDEGGEAHVMTNVQVTVRGDAADREERHHTADDAHTAQDAAQSETSRVQTVPVYNT